MIPELRRKQIVVEAWAVTNELLQATKPLKINPILLAGMTEEERNYFYNLLEKSAKAVHLGDNTWGIHGAKYD